MFFTSACIFKIQILDRFSGFRVCPWWNYIKSCFLLFCLSWHQNYFIINQKSNFLKDLQSIFGLDITNFARKLKNGFCKTRCSPIYPDFHWICNGEGWKIKFLTIFSVLLIKLFLWIVDWVCKLFFQYVCEGKSLFSERLQPIMYFNRAIHYSNSALFWQVSAAHVIMYCFAEIIS